VSVSSSVVVDSDAHVLEPPDLWERYLEQKFIDRAIRIERDDDGLEVLITDGIPVDSFRGTLGTLGGIGMDAKALGTPGANTYVDGFALGSNDPVERLTVMDDEGIDIGIFYPTIGLIWEGWITDPDIATAYSRAYNRWIADFCEANPNRLKPAAHITLLDPIGACAEARRAREDGCISVMLSPDPVARGGRVLDDPELLPFWETLQDLDMPMSFHVVVRPGEQSMIADWLDAGPDGRPRGALGLMRHSFAAIAVMAAFTQTMSTGIFEQYPGLKCGILESGASWIVAWLDRMDTKYRVTQHSRSPLQMLPSEYFFRQCVVSADPDETMTADCVRRLGADYFIWASDYPHIDASYGVVKELKSHLSALPEGDQAKVLGESARKFYRF
jgi:predicted TIM-barrel fold metal-dependent hydrolase